jgi:hypothetical protein
MANSEKRLDDAKTEPQQAAENTSATPKPSSSPSGPAVTAREVLLTSDDDGDGGQLDDRLRPEYRERQRRRR